MNNIPRIVYGNDLNIKIYVTELVSGEPVPYDLSECTDIQVQMFCSKHKTMFELPFTIDEQDSSVINAQIDYRLTHPNTMYGFVVNGYDRNEQHFQWCQKPNEGIMYVEGSSGAYLDASLDNTIDIAARIGFNLNMSNYYDKEEIDAFFENYYTIDDVNTLLNDKANVADLATVATTGDYTDLSNTPTIPTKTSDLTNDSGFVDGTELAADLATKQDVLESGVNIKTINNQSILGEGNIDIQGGGTQVQADYEQIDDTQPDYIKNKPDFDEPQIEFVEEMPSQIDNDKIYVESPVYDFKETTINVVSEVPETVAEDEVVIVSNPIQLKTINNQEIVGEGNIEIQGGGGTQQQADWNQSDNTQVDYIKNKPDLSVYAQSSNLATVATSGSYNDLSNKPTIPAAQVQADYNQSNSSAVDYIKNKPDLTTKQDTLVSGTNIKTINNQSLLGSGNITIQAGGTQIQSDWNQSDNTQVDYIKNKPDLSVYAQSSNLATVATSGSYNDLSNKPNLSNYVTKTSEYAKYRISVIYELRSDPNYVNFNVHIYNTVTNQLVIKGNTGDSWSTFVTTLKNDYGVGIDAISMQKNGTNQLNVYSNNEPASTPYVFKCTNYFPYGICIFLYKGTEQNYWNAAKNGNILDQWSLSYNVQQSDWNTITTTSSSYIKNKPDLSVYARTSNLATVATSGSYNDLSNTPTIPTVPTNVSAFTNDAKYVASNTSGLKIEVVSVLPTPTDNNTIYIVQ